MDNPFQNKYSKTLLSILCYSALVYVFFNYFKDLNWQYLVEIKISWAFLFLALLFGLFTRFLFPMIWIFILKEFGQKINDYWGLNYVYSKSWLARYIPGKIAFVGGKIYFGSQQGLDIKILTIGSLLETIIQIITSLFVGLFILSLQGKFIVSQSLTIFSFICLLLLISSIYPPIFNRTIKKIYKMVKRKELEARYKFRFITLFKTFILFVGLSIFAGAITTLICKSVDITFDMTSNFFYVVAASSLAGSLGIIAVFAPSGLGVKEGVLAIFFSTLFSKEILLAILVTFRLFTTVVDILFFLISKAIIFFRPS